MKTITTYEANGKIIGCFTLPNDEVSLMVNNNFYLEQKSDPRNQYVDNQTIVDMPSKPSDGYDFDYSLKKWVPNVENLKAIIKNQRIKLLIDSDWIDTLSAKARLGDALYQQWADYRQQLRDITSQSGYPLNVVWPTPPQG